MVRCGDIMTLEIVGTNMLGNGVAKADNMVIFCRGAVEGDIVIANVTRVEKNYAEATVTKTLSPSIHRCPPRCHVASVCGGCVFDGVTDAHEENVKRDGVVAAFRREGIAVKSLNFIPTLTAEYRNKAVFHFDEEKRCGFFAAGTKNFVRIEKCCICDNAINFIKNEAERILSGIKEIPAADLTYLYIRYMKETDEATVALGCRGDRDVSRFARELMSACDSVVAVFRGIGDSPEAKGERLELVAGCESITARVAGLDFELSPSAFFQVNISGAEALCREVVRLADIKDGDVAADIYCGTGLFGLSIAKENPGAEIYGIELNTDAVKCANRNAAKNGIGNAFFLAGDSSELKAKTGIEKISAAVVDPPRTGLSKKTVCELTDLSPESIVYVSCNPSTLARDVKTLSDNYIIKDVSVVNMFPRTKHCEVVAHLIRSDAAPFDR